MVNRREGGGSVPPQETGHEAWEPCQIRIIVGRTEGSKNVIEDAGTIVGETVNDSSQGRLLRIHTIKIAYSRVYQSDLLEFLEKLNIPKSETIDILKNQHSDSFGLHVNANYGDDPSNQPTVSYPQTRGGAIELTPSQFPIIKHNLHVTENCFLDSNNGGLAFKYDISSQPTKAALAKVQTEALPRKEVDVSAQQLEFARREVRQLQEEKTALLESARNANTALDETRAQLENALSVKAGMFSQDTALRQKLQAIMDQLKSRKG